MSRKRVFEIIERSEGNDSFSSAYDIFMIVVIIASLVPLAVKADTPALRLIDRITVTIFILDYLLRWATADYKLPGSRAAAFLKYPFTPMALVDLLSILPSVSFLSSGFKLLRVVRMIRAMRVLRAFKAVRYSRSFDIIWDVLCSTRETLAAVGALAVGYILISALIIFNVEPDSFDTFFDAVYWATVSLTTVGYGDIYPVSTMGRIVTMVSSMFGIAIVALPAGVITAGYMSEISREREDLPSGEKEGPDRGKTPDPQEKQE